MNIGCGISSINFCASISDKEMDTLTDAKQHFSDCYLMTSLESLSKTPNGRKIIREQIEHDDKNPEIINCYLYNPDGIKVKYQVPANTAVKGYKKLYKAQKNDIIRSLDISVGEYEKKYQSKPLVCRISDNFKNYTFENNLPSHFLKTFTGIEPTVNIAETDINVDLTGYKDEVMKLFKRMESDNSYNLLIGSGVKHHKGRSWHCYVLEKVDLKNNTVTIKNKRTNIPETMSIDKALKTFKYIVGYFDEDLKK